MRLIDRLPWPVPALLAWCVCWLTFKATLQLGIVPAYALGLATALGVAMSVWGSNWLRRLIISVGFPLSFLMGLDSSAVADVAPWVWLAAGTLGALVYPLNAWRDAPLYPTPAGTFAGVPQIIDLAADAAVLDAGCGLGDGLMELHRALPEARLNGLESSWPLQLICSLRCPYAKVRREDIWKADWSGYDLVYLFQRPESMPRAMEKASAEMHQGAWLISLEFEVAGYLARYQLPAPGGRMLWLYQAPFQTVTGDVSCQPQQPKLQS